MRLVTWNAARNTMKTSFEQVQDAIEELDPDVVVLPETCMPASATSEVHWIGRPGQEHEYPGLAVYGRNGYRVTRDELRIDSPSFFLPLRVSGPVVFRLLAAWPTRTDESSYAAVIERGIGASAVWLSEGPAILAGDLNTSTKVVKQATTHPEFVRRMAELGLVSAYHELGGHAHGAEPEATFLKGRTHDHAQGFHLDYCFLSSSLLPGSQVVVGDRTVWRPRSDHLPVILDVPDANFTSGQASRPTKGIA